MIASTRASLFDAVIFDCDGVIFDTNSAKIEAFRATACDAGFDEQSADLLARWQAANFGTPRRVVFEKLLSGVFGNVPPGAALDSLVASYASRSEALYATADECIGIRDLLDSLSGAPLFVASGSDQEELRTVFAQRGMQPYFSSILGSPTSKRAIVQQIIEELRRKIASPRVILIGDARADYEAAIENGIEFAFVRQYSTARTVMDALVSEADFISVNTPGELVSLLSPALHSLVGPSIAATSA